MNDVIEKNLSNLMVLGHQEYERVPSFVQHADACIIPFKPLQVEVRSCNPIKLWEFFACGKPVITTAMDETNMEGVYWSRTYESFKQNIIKAITSDTDKELRISVAKNNSWDLRVEKLLKWIDEK
jgi:glycosyltransferase involved in cell wall biosynthesis